MHISINLFFCLIFIAFISKYIDKSLGLGYVTILSPVLIIMGFNPITAIPSILLSQIFGSSLSSILKHHLNNGKVKTLLHNIEYFFIIGSVGVVIRISSGIMSISISKLFWQVYLYILFVTIAICIMKTIKYSFFKKNDQKKSTKNNTDNNNVYEVSMEQDTKIEAYKIIPEETIYVVAFMIYLVKKAMANSKTVIWQMPLESFLNMLSSSRIWNWKLILALFIGSLLVFPLGEFSMVKLKNVKMNIFLGMLIVILRVWSLSLTYL